MLHAYQRDHSKYLYLATLKTLAQAIKFADSRTGQKMTTKNTLWLEMLDLHKEIFCQIKVVS